ncbi:phosphohistidine phosphatase [Sphingomonas sp. Leaf17]|uniref:SixA phosphatase family protein n=1 Tax=Sphingomonas sp. Leaf17 TaxID=1735683 RepID=UPI0006F921C9|nr:histidine phosphatase family protein [Sphingomonas sp. Leaf17]KQM62716.1 phosphohistidine phosphatase [Sphingomonas sp. Leaf17]
MKTLTLLRHAKSGWNDPVTRDFDRPLNAKGKRAAALIGRWLRDEGFAFDHVVASPAVRVTETLVDVSGGYGATITPEWDRRVYLASAATLLDVVHALPDTAGSALLVGHNPGLEDLVLMLVPRSDDDPYRIAVEGKYPTATVAQMTFDVASWADVAAGGGRFVGFTRPRDLDPSLGPDSD